MQRPLIYALKSTVQFGPLISYNDQWTSFDRKIYRNKEVTWKYTIIYFALHLPVHGSLRKNVSKQQGPESPQAQKSPHLKYGWKRPYCPPLRADVSV